MLAVGQRWQLSRAAHICWRSEPARVVLAHRSGGPLQIDEVRKHLDALLQMGLPAHADACEHRLLQVQDLHCLTPIVSIVHNKLVRLPGVLHGGHCSRAKSISSIARTEIICCVQKLSQASVMQRLWGTAAMSGGRRDRREAGELTLCLAISIPGS